MEPFLSINHLSLSFSSGKEVFKDASFSLFNKESVGLWSPNGTGKTSLFRVITGLLKPQQAHIVFLGKEVLSEEDFKMLRLKVGYVLQHADDQLFFPQVLDDVAFGPLNQGLASSEALKVSEETLELLGILHLKKALSFELSGGQKKLVTLASVLSMKPEVLLLDEPTNGLDESSKQHFVDVVNKIDSSKIIISHDPEFLSLSCNRFLTIKDLQIKEVDKPMAHQHTHRHFYGSLPHSHE